jgi:threonine aldolase
MDPRDIDALVSSCTRFLSGHGRKLPKDVLAELADWTPPDLLSDGYGEGELIEGFEREIAALLGKESAVFVPSGTMCQPIALRLWSERRRSPHVAFHPTCHLALHEHDGYQLLHGLHGVRVCGEARLMRLSDLERVADPLGALLIELPQREIGGQLPSWDELVAMCGWARERGIPLHLDGARLWECKPFYGRDYAQIAGLFDSVYVSFYKGLGGIAGAVLAGPKEFVAEARIWQRRQGGNLVRLFPYVLAAKKGLEERLPRMAAYHEKALDLAAALRAVPGVTIVPDPPATNMMHLYLRGDRARMEATAVGIARAEQVWLFANLAPTGIPGVSRYELTVGDRTLELPTSEIAGWFERITSTEPAAGARSA